MRPTHLSLFFGSLLLSACGDADSRSPFATSGGDSTSSAGDTGASGAGSGSTSSGNGGGSGGGDTGSGTTGDSDAGPKFDVEPNTTGGECDPRTDPDCMCQTPPHHACDDGTNDPFLAMGVGCPGEPAVTPSITGSDKAVQVRTSFGPTATFDPREGSAYAVIGSGFVAELDQENNKDAFFPKFCSDDLDGKPNNTDLGPLDPDKTLPLPIDPKAVGAQDCSQDPNLVGMGDCSNTLHSQWDQGASARDYTDLRFTATVPPDVISFSYDLAFFTVEWPEYAGSQYNDMYVGWLNSEKWTGNISFDAMGNPISLNAAFFDFLDPNGTLPEFSGTCMKYHGGTTWLTTTAGVTPGETIEVVFAIYDLSDSILDSYAFIDNFSWGCDPTLKPDTKPEG